MYYAMQGITIILMLGGGGDKSSQERHIERAKTLAQELKNEPDQNPSV